MYVENLVALAHPLDNGHDFGFGVFESLSNGANAEIEAVPGAVVELGKSFDTSKHVGTIPAGDAPVTGRRWRVGNVVGQFYFIFSGNGQQAVEEVGNTLENLIDRYITRAGFGVIFAKCLLVVPGVVFGVTAFGIKGFASTQNGQNSRVVVQHLNARLPGDLDHLL